MTARERILSWIAPRFSPGTLVKLRHAYPDPRKMLKSFLPRAGSDPSLSVNARIVVVGLGTAALSCARTLHAEGFRHVTLVARDGLFGGKCVNIGCMPAEFALARGDTSQAEAREALKRFVQSLREDAGQAFAATGYAIETGTAQKVAGTSLHLSDGRILQFDRLVLAIGNRAAEPDLFTQTGALISMEEFWSLPSGSRLTIYADGNPAALGIADIARCQGLKPTLLMAGRNAWAGLPSYRYFVRGLEGAGITIHDGVKMRRADRASSVFEVKGRAVSVEHDAILVASRPSPAFIEIDGRTPTIFDLDLVRACLPARPDIVFIGDGGGFFTSSEADLQAQQLIRSWKYGAQADFRVLEGMPTRIHAAKSLALAGPAWSYAAGEWQEIDFRSLGWSKIHGLEGKLWYSLDKANGKIQAIHICHQQAGELISLAAALMPYPVWDSHWMACSVHPSVTEIFKLVAEDAAARLGDRAVSRVIANDVEMEFDLPALDQIDPLKKLPDWIDQTEWYEAILGKDPRSSLATSFGLFQLEQATGEKFSRDSVSIDIDERRQLCYVRQGKRLVVVKFGAG